MKRIGVLSDTHGFVPPQVNDFFKDCDELWHAGDIGWGVLEDLQKFKPVRAVYGNTDDHVLRFEAPKTQMFNCEGLRVIMTHIGGWPGHYPKEVKQLLVNEKPDIFVCGHSHILRVMYDSELELLHINPGAAGRVGFHKVATLVRFVVDGEPKEMEVLDFDKSY